MNEDRLAALANSIKAAKQVINKVEDKGFTPNNSGGGQHITEEYVDNMLDDNTNYLAELTQEQMEQAQRIPKNTGNFAKSKMPKAILESFMNNPAIDPTQPFGNELSMNQLTQMVKGKQPQQQQLQQQPQQKRQIAEQKQSPQQQPSGGVQLDTKLIEYIVRKTVEETIEQISKKSNINENFKITIGEKTFSGSLTTLNEVKKPGTKK